MVDRDHGATTVASREDIAATFMRKAPPGELMEIYQDVRSLLKDDNALQRIARQAFTDHHKQHFLPVMVEGSDKPALVTSFNQLPDGRFYHPRNKSSFRFDPIHCETSDWNSCAVVDSLPQLEPFRSALEAAIDVYVACHFKHGSANVYCIPKSIHHGGDLVVCIVNTQYQKNNFWSGHWKSQWTISMESDHAANVAGKIDVRIHYFENGNVQLCNSRSTQRNVSFSNDSSFAQSVAKVIADEENACQRNIGDSCKTLGDSTFKGLRRQLPVTRSKIDWSKINYKVNAELKPF